MHGIDNMTGLHLSKSSNVNPLVYKHQGRVSVMVKAWPDGHMMVAGNAPEG